MFLRHIRQCTTPFARGYADGYRYRGAWRRQDAEPRDRAAQVAKIQNAITTALEEGYTSGIDAVLSFAVDGNTIYGRFQDGSNVYAYRLADDDIAFWRIRDRRDSWPVIRRDRQGSNGKASKKQCKNGIICGNTCIAKNKTCHMEPSPKGKAAIASARDAIKALDEFEADFLKAVEGQSKAPALPTAKALKADHITSSDSRITTAALDKALDAIATPGGAERVAVFRALVNQLEIRAVFNDRDKPNADGGSLLRAVDPKSPAGKKMIETLRKKKAEAEARFPDDPARVNAVMRAYRNALADRLVGAPDGDGKYKANGYTSEGMKHVVVFSDSKRSPATFEVKPADLKAASDRLLNTAGSSDTESWSVSKGANQRNAANLITYLHEVGHQIHYSAGTPSPPRGASRFSKYSKTNDKEYFAEHFALWMLDAEGFRRKNPAGAKFIEDSVARAARQKPRF